MEEHECCTDVEGRKFYYVCNKCGKPVRTCPDPACVGVGHHRNEEDWDCREDVPYDDCSRVYI